MWPDRGRKISCNIGIHNIVLHNQILIRHLKNGLEKIPDIIITENGTNSGSILTFTSQVKSLDDMKQIMDAGKVSYSVGFRHFALIDFDKKMWTGLFDYLRIISTL